MSCIVEESGLAVQPIALAPATPWPVKSRVVRQRYRDWRRRTLEEDLTATDLAKILGRPARTVVAGVRRAMLDEEYRQSRAELWLHSDPKIDARHALSPDDVVHLVTTHGPETELGSQRFFREFLTPLVVKILRRYPFLVELRTWLEPPAVPEVLVSSAA